MKLEKNKGYPLSEKSNLILYPLFKIKKKKQTNVRMPATETVLQLYKEINLAINKLSSKQKRMLNQMVWGLANDHFMFPVPFSRNGESQPPLIPNQFTKQGEPKAIYPSNIELTAQIITTYLKESENVERMLRFKECVNNHLSVQTDTEALQQAIIDTIQQVSELQRTNSFILMAPPVRIRRIIYKRSTNMYTKSMNKKSAIIIN